MPTNSFLHLLDIHVRPSAFVKDVMAGSLRNLQDGVEKGGGHKIYGFKVVGENRLIVVLDGAVEAAMTSCNQAYGDQVEVTCSPLRSYENFAETMLGLDKAITSHPYKRLQPDLNQQLYWLHCIVEYPGKKISDLTAMWGREASTLIILRNKSDLQFDVFKVVGERETHVFLRAPDNNIMDMISFKLPIVKEWGDNMHITTKSIIHLDPA